MANIVSLGQLEEDGYMVLMENGYLRGSTPATVGKGTVCIKPPLHPQPEHRQGRLFGDEELRGGLVLARQVWAPELPGVAAASKEGDGARVTTDRASGAGVRWLHGWEAMLAPVPGVQQLPSCALSRAGPCGPLWANHAGEARQQVPVPPHRR